MADVQLLVHGYANSDDRERSTLTSELREELLELDFDDVRHPDAPTVEHAKGSALEWAELAVTLAGSLPALISAVRSWSSRHPGAAVTLKAGGREITLPDATESERARLIEAWERGQQD